MKRQKHTVLVLTLCLVCVPATSLQQDKNFEGDISIWADPDDPIAIITTTPTTATATGTKADDESADWKQNYGHSAGYQPADGHHEATKTYERVVLEGSRIRIGCPHNSRIAPGTSFAAARRQLTSNNKGGQKQFATRGGADSGAATVGPRVKWFRNHVPLMNLNHFQHTNLFADSTTGPQRASSGQLLAPTSESSSTGNTGRQWSQDDDAAGETAPSANVNEPHRKDANMPGQRPAWYVNNLGELVISEVSRYFAGKYTCLSGGRQSEVLLDVLADADGQQALASEQARAIGPKPSRDIVGASNPKSGDSISGKLDFSADQRRVAGNEPIEKKEGFESKTGNAAAGSHLLGDQPSASIGQPEIGVHSLQRPDSDDDDDESPVDNNPSLDESNSIITPKGGADGAALTAGNKEAEKIETLDRDIGESGADELATNNNNNKINVSQRRSRHPVHVVKSQAIQWADLKLVPGFLYTKQHLYCPVTGRTGLQLDHIYPLLRTFCPLHHPPPTTITTSSPATTTSTAHNNLAIRCYLLAQRLIYRLAASNNEQGDYCSAPMLDLLWFKDGRRLEFDAYGRGKGQLNVKLINSSDGNIGRPIPELVALPEHPNRSSKMICPPSGRTLEIDGLRNEAAGRYNCALKLSPDKLRKIIGQLRQWNEPGKAVKWRNSIVVHDNDISASLLGALSQQRGQQRDVLLQIETDGRPKNRSREVREQPGPGSGRVQPLLAQRIGLLESILRGKMSSERALNHIEELVASWSSSSRVPDPLVSVQTFSLLVDERPANSCDLWSTILEAGNAYTRRKLAEFKRLKRSSLSALAANHHESQQQTSSSTEQPQSKASKVHRLPMEGQPEERAESVRAKAINPMAHRISDVDGGLTGVAGSRDDNDLTLDRMQSMPFDGATLATGRGRQQGPLMNNAAANRDELTQTEQNRRQIGTHLQTKSRRESPFDYANERDLSPLYGPSTAIAGATDAATARRRKRSPDFNDELGAYEYMDRGGGAKDLITQRGYHGFNIESRTITTTSTTTTRTSFETPGGVSSALLSLDKYPSMGIGRESRELLVRESVIDDSLQGSARKDVGDNNSPNTDNEPTQISVYTDNLAGLGQSSGQRVFAPGYKLRQLGRYSRASQLDSQLIDSANQSNGLAQLSRGSSGDQSVAESVAQQALTKPTDASDASSPHLQTEPNVGSLSLIDEPLVYDDTLDESLMWKAGQYLYMHMRAIAASSMFGVELAVEWSNERVNGSSSIPDSSMPDGGEDARSAEPLQGLQDDFLPTTESRSASREVRDAVPFATINVISGQNLQLQCTAQALGRLPEVKWYKRIVAIPFGLKRLAEKLVRRIGNDLYWPLTELDLLNEHENLSRSRSFVCSQTTAIFDNLSNQTFTVVTNLQLGQYNDRVEAGAVQADSLDMDDYNLYACIVDADIRHNYATLGVHFREAPNKIPYEIRKRLNARAATTKSEQSTKRKSTQISGINADSSEKFSEYNLYRESLLQFPLKSYWVPIKNRSATDGSRVTSFSASFPLTPTLLSSLIMIVFSSLLALVYLTLRTYRALMQNHLDDELSFDASLQDSIVQMHSPLRQPVLPSTSSRCFCQCQGQQATTVEVTDIFAEQIHGSRCGDTFSTSDGTDKVLYEAHSHIDHYACRSDPLAELPSDSKADYLVSPYQQRQLESCCQSSLQPPNTMCGQTTQPNDHYTVNMVENPLQSEHHNM